MKPHRPDTMRGYAREVARMAQVLRAGTLPDRPGRVAVRKRRQHSTHWTLPARRARTMLRAHRRATMTIAIPEHIQLTRGDARELETFATFLTDATLLPPQQMLAKWGGYMDGTQGGPACP